MDDGAVSISKRNDLSAAALEALVMEHSLLTVAAGETYTVDAPPYFMRQRLTIRGNGAELRNVNQTPLNIDHTISQTLPLGVSMVWTTSYLTYHSVAGASGPELALAAGAGANFAPGDLVVLHGATKYYGPGNAYEVYRNYTRARVLSATADTVVIDRALPPQLLEDMPVIGLSGAPDYYLLYAPHVSHLTLSSDLGNPLQCGGVIDGVFRDLTIDGRNGIVADAQQDCLFENIRFRAWRKICELSEGSYGTVVRNVRGVLSDASSRFGGASDAAPFFLALGENCAECLFDDFTVDSGPNDPTGGAGMIFGPGRDNEMRNSRLSFPALTGVAISIQSNATMGNPNVDCGFRNVTVTAPMCSQFVACNDAGAGIVRPIIEGSRFYGTPTLRAATLDGSEGLMIGNQFESGDVALAGASTMGWRIEGNRINGAMVLTGGTNNVIRENYIKEGFAGLTDQFIKTNSVFGNESDATRRLAAAAVISSTQSNIVSIGPNSAYSSATFAAGDLSPGDKIFFSTQANASSSGTSNRFSRVSLGQGSGTMGLGSAVINQPSGHLGIQGVLEIRTDTFVVCDFSIGDRHIHNVATVPSVSANGLILNLEYWVSSPGEHINVRGVRIVAVKPGMKHLPAS